MRYAQALLLMSCWALATADSRSASQPEKKSPAKKDKTDAVPGYKLQKIEGFSFLIQEKVFEQDLSGFERKPLEALELECKTLTKILSPGAVETLKALVIWVEWDEKVPLPNGRPGNALAVYSGSTPAQVVKEGKHPLRAKTVTIYSLKSLTENRQPKRDRGDCILLHEIAHAVHDQLLGNHTGIKAAYQQAMERKLYDKDLYIATNEREFFAELTCAYLDRLRYYPYTRADLEKHDPVSFKLMESIWSAAAKKSDAGKKPAGPTDGSDQFDLSVVVPADVQFGKVILGAAPAPDALSGKVVVIAFWGGNTSNVLNRLDRLHDELANYGLLAIGGCSVNLTPDEMKSEAEKRCNGFPVLERVYIKDKKSSPVVFRTQPGAHTLVFDHAGKCIFRGTVYDAEKPVRTAIGRKLLADATGGVEPGAAFKAVIDAFEGGAEPVAVLSKITPLTNSLDERVKTAAKKLSEAILAPGQKALEEAKAVAKSDPVAAFVTAEGVAARYKGTQLANRAVALNTNLRQDRAVAVELKARAILTQVQKTETYLRGQPGSFDPTNPQFQMKHRAAIAQMQAAVEQLRKQYPNARATAEALKISREFFTD